MQKGQRLLLSVPAARPAAGAGAMAVPPGPEPCRDVRLMPASAAMRAAIGETSKRPPAARLPSVGGAVSCRSGGSTADVSLGFAVSGLGDGGTDFASAIKAEM